MTNASSFQDIPKSPAGHFVLWLYRGIYRVLLQTKRVGELNGQSIEALFRDFPFLAHYLTEIRPSLPEGLSWDAGDAWWSQNLEEWERQYDGHLPLRALQTGFDLSRDQVLALMLAGLVEEDSRFGTLFAALQSPLTNRRPTLELLSQFVIDSPFAASRDSWTLSRPLLEVGLLETPDPEVPRSEWLVRVPPLLWDAIRGERAVTRGLGLHLELDQGGSNSEIVAPEAFKTRLAQLPVLLSGVEGPLVLLRGMQGSPLAQVSRSIATSLGLGMLRIDPDVLEDPRSKLRHLVGPACTLLGALPVVHWELGPSETKPAPHFGRYAGPVIVELGLEGGLVSPQDRTSLTLEVPFPLPEERLRLWQRSLDSYAPSDLDAIVRGFQLPGELLARLARGAVMEAKLNGRSQIVWEDAAKASEWLNRQNMGDLADRIETHGTWEELIASPQAREKLRELEGRCHRREELLDRLGKGFGRSGNRGVRALFSGPSGTGKTLAARVLAHCLGRDLYRVDLASVINKYIGETEKNLHRVLSRAEALDVVLLIDEGDALLGQRTDVRSANDRYANLETNYLLQRLEHYQGIVVVTTNLGDNIDPAFQRRMDTVVNFLPPGPEERRDILELHLPVDHEVPDALLQQVAGQCRLTGGQLRNAAVLSALMALEEGDRQPIGERHLLAALRGEYRKMGSLFPFDTPRHAAPSDGGLEALRAVLTTS